MVKTTNRFSTTHNRVLVAMQLGFMVTALAACATHDTALPATPRPLGSSYVVFAASDPGQASGPNEPGQARAHPRGDVTLRDSIALALLQNPRLAAFSFETRVREAEALQAGLFPNPELTVEAEDFGGTDSFRGYDGAQTTVFLGQLVELGGKRTKRRRLADRQRDLASWDYEVQRLDVLTQVAREFTALLEAQGRAALADELLAISRESLEAVSKQVRAGATSSVEQLRAEVSVDTAELERRGARADLEASRSRLAAMWGANAAEFASAVGDLRDVEAPPALGLIRDKVGQNPDVARWAAELAHRDAAIALADAGAIPDFTAGGGVRRLERDDVTTFLFGVTVPLPVFDRNQGGREATRYGLAKARYEQRSAAIRAASALEVAYADLESSYDQIEALRARVLPHAARAHEGVQTGYLRGLFRYVDVLDAQRTFFELRGREISALGSYHRAVADVERLIGEPLFGGSPQLSEGDDQ